MILIFDSLTMWVLSMWYLLSMTLSPSLKTWTMLHFLSEFLWPY